MKTRFSLRFAFVAISVISVAIVAGMWIHAAAIVPRTQMNWEPLVDRDLDGHSRKRPMLIAYQTSIVNPIHNKTETPRFRKFVYSHSIQLRTANIGWDWEPVTLSSATLKLAEHLKQRHPDCEDCFPAFIICFPNDNRLLLAPQESSALDIMRAFTSGPDAFPNGRVAPMSLAAG